MDELNNTNTPINQISENIPLLNIFQQNINEPYMNFTKNINMDFKVNPLILFYDFDSYKYYNIGNKVLAPKHLLNKLSKYDNLEYPIHLEINNKIFTIHDFIDTIDCIFIPTDTFYNLNLVDNQSVSIKILKIIPPKATYIKLKPCNKKFYEITNIKTYLEIHFKKLYSILEKDEILKLPYGNDIIVTDCKPNNIVSINEIEELELDFEPQNVANESNEFDKVKKPNVVAKLNFSLNRKNNKSKEEIKEKIKKELLPFSGKGRRLGK